MVGRLVQMPFCTLFAHISLGRRVQTLQFYYPRIAYLVPDQYLGCQRSNRTPSSRCNAPVVLTARVGNHSARRALSFPVMETASNVTVHH